MNTHFYLYYYCCAFLLHHFFWDIYIYIYIFKTCAKFKMYFCFLTRIIFSAKEGEFSYLSRGGEAAVFVKAKEAQSSRKNQR